MLDGGEAVRDERAARVAASAEVDGRGASHHADNIWVGMGIHGPAPNGLHHGGHGRKHRRHRHGRSSGKAPAALSRGDTEILDQEEQNKKAMAPGQRIQFLLHPEDEGEAGDDRSGTELCEGHPLFTEMAELHADEWRETARWVKFEEDVEEGGNRWSKPHVATLSLHSLFELRSLLMNGCVILDMDAADLPQIVDIMLDKMVAAHQVEFQFRDEVRDAILRRHTHQYEHAKHHGHGQGHHGHQGSGQGQSFLSTVRSLADIGKSFSHGKNMSEHGKETAEAASKKMSTPAGSGKIGDGPSQLALPKVGSFPKDLGRSDSHASDFHSKGATPVLKSKRSVVDFFRSNSRPILQSPSDANLHARGNQHFMKKLPPGSEASNVLIGEVDFLAHHASAFIRLKSPTLLGDLTEVPVPTRFLFILLGPTGHGAQFREIGRAIATLMSDEIFHDVAYKARNRSDLLDGVDEFLDQVTVLPPGEWDPDIRIEPPSSIPSQEKRKHAHEEAAKAGGGGGGEGGDGDDEEGGGGAKEEEGHASDPTLKRTGRLFGGLILDIKRKAPFYLSDWRDALNVQCFATFIFMYFALLAPIVTFGGLLSEATGKNMAAMENLLSGAICGVVYHLFSGQPLTIIGSTGPVLVFETIIYEVCRDMGLAYMSVRWWINMWMALILFGMVATDASALVSYITRFTEESFATLIAVIFIYEAIVKLFALRGISDIITYFGPEVPEAAVVANETCQCTGGLHRFDNMDKLHKIASKKKIKNLTGESWFSQAANGSFATVDLDATPARYCEAFKGDLDGEGCYKMNDVFLLSALLMIGTFFIAYTLKKSKSSCYFPTKIRHTLSDFAVMIAIALMAGVDYAFGLDTPKLYVPESFKPTSPDRGWVIHPFGTNPWWSFLLAIPPALLGCVLIFMDQQITAVIVNRKENKLKKGCGYHLDLFILSFLIVITGVLGLPIYVAATVLSINHVNSLGVESESRAPGEKPTFIGCREQRVTGVVTFIFIGLSVLMTKVLKFISMPVLYGVFLYMGVMALNGIQLIDRILLFFMPMKYQPDYMYLRLVPIRRVHYFTLCQVFCLAALWVIKSIKQTKILFPVMLVVMVAVRKGMECFFSKEELQALDDKMPDFHLRKKDDKRKKKAKEDTDTPNAHDSPRTGSPAELKAVKTEGHLHIPMASGNVMKIPLASINEETSKASCLNTSPAVNISEEIKGSGMWKHIESQGSFPKLETRRSSPPMDVPKAAIDDDDDFAPITIKVEGSAFSTPSPASKKDGNGEPEHHMSQIRE